MKSFLFALLFLCVFQEVPLKPKGEFEVKLDYTFKTRPQEDRTLVKFEEPARRGTASPLPYLVLNVSVMTLNENISKAVISNNKSSSVTRKKVQAGSVIEIDMGFTDDVKGRITAHEYAVTFIDGKKNPVDKIVIFIDTDGTFIVNGEKRGKF